MNTKRWLISWIGKNDRDAAEGRARGEIGPIASALADQHRFDRIYLLTNYEFEQSQRYCAWLEKKTGLDSSAVDLFQVDLTSPIDYASIYGEVTKNLRQAGLPRDDVELTFHLSPGTSAMTAIWIMLAKTRFPARLIQTSREQGVESVNFFFDLASDFLPEFLQRSRERISRLTQAAKPVAPEFAKILHQSSAIGEQIDLARRISVYSVPVLILGETGTGKELFAEAIHAASERATKPFIAVNCGAIAPELANSELFGHKRGSFTGATGDRKGHFQEAHGGTLFLDEVGDLPLDSQAKLLRALQSHEVTPLGASKPIKVDVRIVAATHRELAEDVASGRFREDLFHRLAVGIIRLPPLRERDGDVGLLIDTFLDRINSDARGRPEAQEKKLSPGAKNVLLAHPWPGNIRELYHTLLRAAIWARGPTISAGEVQASLVQLQRKSADIMGRPLAQGFDLQGLLDTVARDYLVRALRQTGDRKGAAAQLLGFSNYQTLGNWMKRLGVATDESVD